MTTTTTEDQRPPTDPPDGITIELPDEPTGMRAQRQREQRRRRRLQVGAYLGVLVILGAAIPALTYAGLRTIVDGRRHGEVIRLPDRVRDPGLATLASIPDTPAGLVLQTGLDGSLVGATVFGLAPGGEGGSVTFVPVSTLVAGDTGEQVPLAALHAAGGPAAARAGLERLLGARFALFAEFDDVWITLLAGPAGVFTVDNPAAVVADLAGGETQRFPEGPYDVWPDKVGPFLRAQAADEAVAVRLARHEQIWSAWLAGVAANPAGSPRGNKPTDLAYFLKRLAAGQVVYATLPVTPDTTVASADEPLRTDPLQVHLQAARLLPGALVRSEGTGTRIRLLDGVDDQAKLETAARALVDAGAEIVLVGDAPRFADKTEIVYYGAGTKTAAARLAASLGVGSPALGAENVEDFDVTIVVGSDFTVGVADPTTTTGGTTAG